jgi:hypothetical protein
MDQVRGLQSRGVKTIWLQKDLRKVSLNRRNEGMGGLLSRNKTDGGVSDVFADALSAVGDHGNSSGSSGGSAQKPLKWGRPVLLQFNYDAVSLNAEPACHHAQGKCPVCSDGGYCIDKLAHSELLQMAMNAGANSNVRSLSVTGISV